MKSLENSDCQVQIFICTNERPAPKTCCKMVGGQELYQAIKQKLKDTGLIATHWATRTGCLGFCNTVGTTVLIQPAGRPAQWYAEVEKEDLDFIWGKMTESHP